MAPLKDVSERLASIKTPGTFATRRTGFCGTLARFLVAADETRLEWPLAKDSRAHIHQILDAHNLPVTHTTRRAGRPFTLVLTKTDALFEREAKERELWEGDLRWLTKAAPAF